MTIILIKETETNQKGNEMKPNINLIAEEIGMEMEIINALAGICKTNYKAKIAYDEAWDYLTKINAEALKHYSVSEINNAVSKFLKSR